MVWGCMGWNGVRKLIEVQGKMNAHQYCEILEAGVAESFEKLDMVEDEQIFQQDNDPKHISKKVQKWFEDSDIKVLDWPAQLPDLNPIEHLWHHVKLKLDAYDTKPKNMDELWDIFDAEWNKFTKEDMKKYYESMPKRIEEIIKVKCGYTKRRFGFPTGVNIARVRFLGVSTSPSSVKLNGKDVKQENVSHDGNSQVLSVELDIAFNHGFTVQFS